jgi:hypothetical protein
MSSTHIVQLPSGNTWAFTTKPSWGLVRRLGESDDLNHHLALFTAEWSFGQEVTPDTIDALDLEDVIVAVEGFNEHVLPLFDGLTKRLSKGSPTGSMTTTPPTTTATSESGELTSEN